MFRRSAVILSLVCAATFGVKAFSAIAAPQAKTAAKDDNAGWTLPADAAQKKSPLTVDAKVLAQGKTVFKSKCQKCHGANGLGDGPDADPDHQEDMDLTRSSRAAKNPEGVMFYKVTNGRKSPKMTPFKDQLSAEQIWAVVAYAQSLRK
jgi:mono/diheme cytochrome c family protein